MNRLKGLAPERVFYYFEKICSIPHGSGNQEAISQFCVDFAVEHTLRYIRDDANNVIIYKEGKGKGENSDPIILQGHLDMVCQKTADCDIDFINSGLDIFVDGDLIRAKGTTLGADNGIAVAMILAILERDDITHPPIEAVFTTDEETGMIGALALDFSNLKGKRMINLDTENPERIIVSCAGGSYVEMTLPIDRNERKGTKVTITLSGLLGGHSGAEIHKGRVNADILAGRVLNEALQNGFSLISVCGGDKDNAIPRASVIEAVVDNATDFTKFIISTLDTIKREISEREKDFDFSVETGEEGVFSVMTEESMNNVVSTFLTVPNGIMDMSVAISGLVETSLNLGVLRTEEDGVIMAFSLRSNKITALRYLEKRLKGIAGLSGAKVKTSGHYPPWEYKADSPMQKIYKETFSEIFGEEATVAAIHAGLECGVFDSAIEGFDCISTGPIMWDIHTTEERLSISSTDKMYRILEKFLENCI